MHKVGAFRTGTQQRDWSGVGPTSGQGKADCDEDEQQRNRRFVMLLDAFRESGGLARADEVASQFQRRSEQHISVFGGWLIKRQAIGFEWNSKLWMPLFQFSSAVAANSQMLLSQQ
jgi:hypothetical protein